MGDEEARRRDIAARIGAAIRDAQYALTVNSPQRVPNAMSESHAALVALSEYLALPNGVPKAAAVAKRIAKVWRSIMALLHHGGSAAASTTQCDTADLHDELTGHERSMLHFLDEAADDSELQRLREKLAGLQEERDGVAALLHGAQQELATLKASIDSQTRDSPPSTAELERVRNENNNLRELLQEEVLKATALAESLSESNAQLHQMRLTNAAMEASLEQHRSDLKEKERELAAAVRAASRAAVLASPATDTDELEALHLQVKLLRQALRECSNNSDAAEIKAGKKTLVDVEYEHQEQLLAMKETLEAQCKRESNLTQHIENLKKFIVETENELAHARQRAEEAERVSQETHGTVERLATLEAALEHERAQHADEVESLRVALEHARQRAEEAERVPQETHDTAEQRHGEQLATLEAALEHERAQHADAVEKPPCGA
ncbi:uncharacterized protein Tco025E_00499 [Trypanosoma conorhini]|uniref:Uncharacterized protein n=1 Tax=Trypanosoma conorhini TaxID=83891 RepID=A0A3R7P1E5_9TRYP|nr:uncharacterized protein Tco025E_00499 [Trypanosoma conorhini]RNF27307.1 hypothetical protein Tco025E_00499 [Trypanosoma conorhini]